MHQRSDDYREQAGVRAWRYSSGTRVAHVHRPMLGRRRERTLAEYVEFVTSATRFAPIGDRDALAPGHRLVERLPPRERQELLFGGVEDVTMADIAQVLDCALLTASTRPHTAHEPGPRKGPMGRMGQEQP